MRAVSLILSAALLLLIGEGASAQTADRTIDEIRTETLARARPAPTRRSGSIPRMRATRSR